MQKKPRVTLLNYIPLTFGLSIALFFGALFIVFNQAGPSQDAGRPALPAGSPCEDPAASQERSGTSAGASPNYLHACGSELLDSTGKKVQITGVNWFGFETDTFSPHGLDRRNWKSLLDQVTAMGFNTIRLPYTNEMLDPGAQPKGIDYRLNPDLEGLSALELMDRVVDGARERGLKIILDRHRPERWGQSPLWYTDRMSEQRWIEDWRMLAARYRGNDTVIGVDLHNEPKDQATWGTGDPETDWRLAAERAGNAILEVNPYLLVLVQGVQWSGWDPYWWGGSLRAARKYPVRLTIPGRLVYSPHDYGPGVYPQPWFWDEDFPANLGAIWDEHWGFLKHEGIAPVIVGEFGGRSVGRDREGLWQRSLVDYMKKHDIGYLHWALNPDSSDTGGLLTDDWKDLVRDRGEVIASYLAPPILGNVQQNFGPPSGRIRVHYLNPDLSEVDGIRFNLQIENDRAQPLSLSDIEIRYWFDVSELPLDDIDAEANMPDTRDGEVRLSTAKVDDRGGRYLKLTFGQGISPVAPYGMSANIEIRMHKKTEGMLDQSNDYSYQYAPDWRPSDRITLYQNGRLIWGVEPRGGKASSWQVVETGMVTFPADTKPVAAGLPRGVISQVFLGGVEEPSAMVFSPDGRLFYAERRTGRIRVVENGKLDPRPFFDFAVSGHPQAGLLGLALDPQFDKNHYVYAFFTEAVGQIDGRGRGPNSVVRLTDAGGQGVNPIAIVTDLPSDFIGNGGALRFGPDGFLYVGLGSGTNPWASRDPRTPAGKILRYGRDGNIPTDNPLVGRRDVNRAIFASGFSSPFGMAFHPLSGGLLASDSNLAGDEINLVSSGGNHGAPEIGPSEDSELIAPIATYVPSLSLAGIEFYTGSKISEWRNDMFAMNIRRGELRRFRLSPPSFNRIVAQETIARVSGFAVTTGADGALYYSSLDTIYRLWR